MAYITPRLDTGDEAMNNSLTLVKQPSSYVTVRKESGLWCLIKTGKGDRPGSVIVEGGYCEFV